MPIAYFDEGIAILRNSFNSARAQELGGGIKNWNQRVISVGFANASGIEVAAISRDGESVLRNNAQALEFWHQNKRVLSVKERVQTNEYGEMNPSSPGVLALSPDGLRWATASELNGLFDSRRTKPGLGSLGVVLWNGQSGRQLVRRDVEGGNVTALSFSPDSKTLAGVTADGYAFLWNASDGNLIRKWRAHPWVAATVAWSPDGATLLTGANPRLGEDFGNWAFIKNGSGVSGGGGIGEGTFTVGKTIIKTDPQGGLTINGQTDRSLRLWNAQTGQLLHNWESASGICSAQFSPDGSEIAVGTHGEALIFDAVTLTVKRRLPMPNYPQWPASVAWSPDGATLAVACAPELTLWRAH